MIPRPLCSASRTQAFQRQICWHSSRRRACDSWLSSSNSKFIIEATPGFKAWWSPGLVRVRHSKHLRHQGARHREGLTPVGTYSDIPEKHAWRKCDIKTGLGGPSRNSTQEHRCSRQLNNVCAQSGNRTSISPAAAAKHRVVFAWPASTNASIQSCPRFANWVKGIILSERHASRPASI